jgi:hypothetical protein
MMSVVIEFDNVVFSERFPANRTMFRNLIQAFLASWMSTLQDTDVAINGIVFFEADVASVGKTD